MKIIDISLSLNEDTIIFPKNAPIKIEKYKSLLRSHSNLSNLHLGSHSGTHLDVPLHVFKDGASLDKIRLSVLVGPCKVYDFSYLQPGEYIKVQDFLKASIKIEKGDRILVKTSNSLRGFDEFYKDFVYLDGDCAQWLAEQEIILFGIDSLSVKKFNGSDNRSHTSLLEVNIPIIEGLDLKDVKQGEYELYCLPLKFIGIEGGPVRAILIQKD